MTNGMARECLTIPAHLERFITRLEGVTHGYGDNWKALCPSHEDTTASLSISLGSKGQILYRCGAGCSQRAVVDALGIGFDELYPDDEEPVQASRAVKGVSSMKDVHDIYQDILANLTVSDKHLGYLKARGIESLDAANLGYRTLDWIGRCALCDRLSARYSRDVLEMVPGITIKDNKVSLVAPTGSLLIPIRSDSYKIQAIHVRADVAPKFRWLSGGGSPSCGSPAHVTRMGADKKASILIEGPIKAESAALNNLGPQANILGFCGASNWKSCLPFLDKYKADSVSLAFDQDWRTNTAVGLAMRAAVDHFSKTGAVYVGTWDPQYKGIDDALAARATIGWTEAKYALSPTNCALKTQEEQIILPTKDLAEPIPAGGLGKGPSLNRQLVVRASSIKQQPVQYLDDEYPFGRLTTVEDNFPINNFVGRASSGRAGSKSYKVLFLSHESESRSLVPRLAAAGANLDNILFPRLSIMLPSRINNLEEIISKEGVDIVAISRLSEFLDDKDKYKIAHIGLNYLMDKYQACAIGRRDA